MKNAMINKSGMLQLIPKHQDDCYLCEEFDIHNFGFELKLTKKNYSLSIYQEIKS
jgi:hypothetical protein